MTPNASDDGIHCTLNLRFRESIYAKAVIGLAAAVSALVAAAIAFLVRHREHSLLRASSLELSFALLVGTRVLYRFALTSSCSHEYSPLLHEYSTTLLLVETYIHYYIIYSSNRFEK